jgi:hypothetical protein
VSSTYEIIENWSPFIISHYSLPGHSHWNFRVQIIEKVTPNTPTYRLEREDHWIKKLATKIPLGLNKND